ncbi:hypothetical protein HanIR_Chr02g0066681 [Helianthus annuus]|nr:hypothetical protein HanIR_Chr02g0066681 [Helianthus annuus]
MWPTTPFISHNRDRFCHFQFFLFLKKGPRFGLVKKCFHQAYGRPGQWIYCLGECATENWFEQFPQFDYIFHVGDDYLKVPRS